MPLRWKNRKLNGHINEQYWGKFLVNCQEKLQRWACHVNILTVYLTSRPGCKVPLNIHAMDETHTDPPPAGATSIPPAARHAANKRFIIPLNTRTILLPDSSISLKQLADFTLPAVKAVTSSASEPSNTIFFSKEEPSVVNASLISKLRYLPTPDESTVRRLVQLNGIV